MFEKETHASSEEKGRRGNRPQPSSKDKLMEILARRDHSENELIQKLSKKYSPQQVQEAIQWAREQNLMAPPEELSVRIARTLHRKYKGIHFINEYLHEKGLPSVAHDSDLELEKARYLVKNKSTKNFVPDKLARFLAGRGFDSDTIRKVIYEKR